MVVLLPGQNQDADDMERLTHFDQLVADKDGIITVYPNAMRGQWNIGVHAEQQRLCRAADTDATEEWVVEGIPVVVAIRVVAAAIRAGEAGATPAVGRPEDRIPTRLGTELSPPMTSPFSTRCWISWP